VLKSDLMQACTRQFQSEVEGILALVRSLSEGVGPSPHGALSYSDYFKLCLKRMENFMILPGNSSDGVGTLYGRKALMSVFSECEKKHAAGEQFELRTLAPLRTYSWLLTQDDRQKSDVWIHACVSNRASFLNKSIADKPAAKSEAQPLHDDSGSHSRRLGDFQEQRELEIVVGSAAAAAASDAASAAAPSRPSGFSSSSGSFSGHVALKRGAKAGAAAKKEKEPAGPHSGLAKFFKK